MISRKEAADTIEMYPHNHQKISAYMQACIDFGKKTAMSRRWLLRRRYVPELASKTQPAFLGERGDERADSRHCVRSGSRRRDPRERELAQKMPQAQLILQVHDELIVDCPASDTEQVKEIVTDRMQHIMELRVPLWLEAAWAELVGGKVSEQTRISGDRCDGQYGRGKSTAGS